MLLSVGVQRLEGQQLAPVAAHASVMLPAPAQDPPTPARGEFVVRLVSASIGSFVGLYGAAMTWAIVGCGGDSGCGTSGAAIIGVLAGSSLLGALPERGSKCGFRGRLLLALPLATVGALAGAMAPSESDDVVFTIPVGAAIGATLGASIC